MPWVLKMYVISSVSSPLRCIRVTPTSELFPGFLEQSYPNRSVMLNCPSEISKSSWVAHQLPRPKELESEKARLRACMVPSESDPASPSYVNMTSCARYSDFSYSTHNVNPCPSGSVTQTVSEFALATASFTMYASPCQSARVADVTSHVPIWRGYSMASGSTSASVPQAAKSRISGRINFFIAQRLI